MEETWVSIPFLDGYYEASNLGRIRRSKPGRGTRVGRIKKLSKNPNGYMQVALSMRGHESRLWVHRLIMSAFSGDDLEGLEVHHKDGNPENNRLDNLRVVTLGENRKLDLIRRIERMSREIEKWRKSEHGPS